MNKILLIIISAFTLFVTLSCSEEDPVTSQNSNSENNQEQDDSENKSITFKYDENFTDSIGAMYCEDNGMFVMYGLKNILDPMTNHHDEVNFVFLSKLSLDNQSIDQESGLLIITDSIGVPLRIISQTDNFVVEKRDNNSYDILYYDKNEVVWKEMKNLSFSVTDNKTRASIGAVPHLNVSKAITAINFVRNLIASLGVQGAEKVALGYWGMHTDLIGVLNNELGLIASELTALATKSSLLAEFVVYLFAKQEEYNILLRRELGKTTRIVLDNVVGGKFCTFDYMLSGLEKSASIYACVSQEKDDDLYTHPAIGGRSYDAHLVTNNANNGTYKFSLNGLEEGKYYMLLRLESNNYKGVGIITSPDIRFTINYGVPETRGSKNNGPQSTTVYGFYSTDGNPDFVKQIGLKVGFAYSPNGINWSYISSALNTDGSFFVNLQDIDCMTYYHYKAYIEINGIKRFGAEKVFYSDPPFVDGVWQVEQGDGDSFTVTFENGVCTWSKTMEKPGSYGFGSNREFGFSVFESWWLGFGTNWVVYHFSGTLNDINHPTSISGNVVRNQGNEFADHNTLNTSFTAVKL